MILKVLDLSNNLEMNYLICRSNPLLKELWLKTGQRIHTLYYDSHITTIKYKD